MLKVEIQILFYSFVCLLPKLRIIPLNCDFCNDMNSNNLEIIFVEVQQKNVEITPYPVDFSKVCRTCMNSNTIVVPILESKLQNGTTLADVLYKCASVQVHPSDSLPLNICNNCLNEVSRIQIFREQCYNTEQSLKKLLASSPTFEENETCNNEVYDNVQSPLDIKEELPEANCKKRNRKKLLVSSPTFEENKTYNNEVYDGVLKVKEELPQAKHKKRNQSKPVSKSHKKLQENFKDEHASLEHQNKPKNVNPRNFECEICNKKFRIMFKLQEHMRSHKKEKPYVCELCGLSFSLTGNLQRHMKIHTGELPHVCHYCGKGFIKSASLHDHLKTHTEMLLRQLENEPNVNGIFICKYCELLFRRKTSFLKHLESHNLNAIEKTDDLEQPIENKNKTEDVVQVKKSDKYYFCEICNRLCNSELLLKSHLLTHEVKKSFLCSDCGKSFKTKASLQTHIQVHSGMKLYACKVCFKSFTSMDNLKSHTMIHMGLKPHRCELCPKTFTQWAQLKGHLRTHNGEKPYACDFCDKTFALKVNLTVHIRRHTGENPYVCDYCGKVFYHSSNMKKHKKIHEGGKTIISKIILSDDILQNYEETINSVIAMK